MTINQWKIKIAKHISNGSEKVNSSKYKNLVEMENKRITV